MRSAQRFREQGPGSSASPSELISGPIVPDLVSGEGGRQYVPKISDQAMRAASVMLQGACPGGDQER
jgi:hypothetical protein